MKKIYALAAVALMAMSANAQNGAPLYATGAGDFPGGEWAPATPSEFVYADGVYTLEITNLTQIKISTVTGASDDPEADAWTLFNGGAYDCGEEGYGNKQGVAVALVANPNAQNIAAPWKGDYTITVAGDLSTITLSTETPEPTGPTPIYFRGDMNNWGNDGKEVLDLWKLEEFQENVYKFTCAEGQAILAGETFKIADADWNIYNVGGNNETTPLNADYQVYNGGDPANMTLEAEWNGVAYLDLRDAAESYIWFSNDKDALPDWDVFSGVSNIGSESNEAPVYFNLQGVRVANPENGLFIVVKDGKAVKVVK